MQTHQQYSTKPSFALLLLGAPFTGKSTIAMQFPDPYFMDFDDKLLSAVTRFPGKKFWFDCPLRKPDNTPVQEDLRWEYAAARLNEAWVAPEPKTIILDSATAMSELIKQHIMRFPTPGTKGQLMVGGLKTMEQTQWQPFSDIWRRTILGSRASGKLTVVIAHEEADKDELTGFVSIKPLVQGKLKHGIAGLFTDVWHTDVRIIPDPKKPGATSVEYFVRAAPTPRMPFLGNSLNLPNEFVFSWDLIKDKLVQPAPTPTTPVATP